MNRRHSIWLIALCTALCVPVVQAQSWPTRPVKLVVSLPAGSSADTVARVLATRFQAAFGQPFVVENRVGAGGNIAADFVAKAAPDGYTLLVSTNAPIATNKVLYKDLPYDPEKDLEPVSLLAGAPQILVVHPSVPAKTLREFIAYARAHPGQLSYGSAGSGSAAHLSMELLKFDQKVSLVHIPYRGIPQSVNDVLGGITQATFGIAPGVAPHVKSGRLRALAVTSLKRIDAAPEIPSVAELGFPQFEALAWIGLLAPAQTPPEILSRLNEQVQKALDTPEVAKALQAQGFQVLNGSAAEFRSLQKKEIAKWGNVIRVSGAKPD